MAKQTFTTGQVLTAAQMTSLQQTAMGGGSTTAKTASYVLVAADAGTVVQMNAAGATTITVNTALFAAGDSVQIQNIGAGVCTITAGTATVTTAGSLALSQWEGGNLYFTSTSASIFFDIVQSSGMSNPMTTTGDTIYSSSGSTPARLGIGTTGQVLTVASGLPSWATVASSSGPAFSAKRATSNQTFSSATWTKAEYNSEFFDLDSCYDSTTNYRFTPTKAGIYLVSFISEIASTTSGDIYTAIYKNGTNYATITGLKLSTFLLASGASLISMNGTTDYLEIYVYAAGSSPKIDLGTAQFSAGWIRSN
jgi:hypothetical protein